MTTMKHVMLGALALLTLTAMPVTASDVETGGDGNCNDTNYGIQANTYIVAERDCSWYEDDHSTYTQHCEGTTKVGFAAGSGAGHNGEASSAQQGEVTAGTRCTNGSPQG